TTPSSRSSSGPSTRTSSRVAAIAPRVYGALAPDYRPVAGPRHDLGQMRRILVTLALLAAASPAAGAPGALVVRKAITVGKHPAGVAVAAGSVWVTNDVDNTVSQVDPATGAVVRTVRLHGRDFPDPSVAVVGGGSVWVAAPTTGTISRIDPKTGALLA